MSENFASRTVAVVQARLSSERLPRKVLLKLADVPIIQHIIDRLRASQELDDFCIAIPFGTEQEELRQYVRSQNIRVIEGPEDNVLSRFFIAAKGTRASRVVRITSDCPLFSPRILDEMIREFKAYEPSLDFLSNTLERTFPRGYDIEIFTLSALEKAFHLAKEGSDREHVTPFIRDEKNGFRLRNFKGKEDHSDLRLTVDTQEDFDLLEKVFKSLYRSNPLFDLDSVVKLLKEHHPEWIQINAHIEQKKL